MEILIVPLVAAFVILHTPVGAAEGYPVPLGIASFDPDVVHRVNTYVSEHTAAYKVGGDQARGLRSWRSRLTHTNGGASGKDRTWRACRVPRSTAIRLGGRGR